MRDDVAAILVAAPLLASVAVGLAWWVTFWTMEVQADSSFLRALLALAAAVQLATWVIAYKVWNLSRNVGTGVWSLAAIVIGSVLVVANGMFFFTPALGIPLALIAGTIGGLVIRANRGGSTESSQRGL